MYECLIPHKLFNLGIGNVILSRRLPSGQIAVAVFLLDVFCLGVKDAFYASMNPGEYTWQKERIAEQGSLDSIDPACGRKLIEGAVQYAEQLGLAPHSDYHVAKKIFGDIDPAVCAQEFVYGREGKPFYVAGPNDTPGRSRQIMALLEKACGPDGFHYLVLAEPLEC